MVCWDLLIIRTNYVEGAVQVYSKRATPEERVPYSAEYGIEGGCPFFAADGMGLPPGIEPLRPLAFLETGENAGHAITPEIHLARPPEDYLRVSDEYLKSIRQAPKWNGKRAG
jgi:hypothetical protein